MIEMIGPMKCNMCGREWIAAMECAKTERLECPGCGYMVWVSALKGKNNDNNVS